MPMGPHPAQTPSLRPGAVPPPTVATLPTPTPSPQSCCSVTSHHATTARTSPWTPPTSTTSLRHTPWPSPTPQTLPPPHVRSTSRWSPGSARATRPAAHFSPSSPSPSPSRGTTRPMCQPMPRKRPSSLGFTTRTMTCSLGSSWRTVWMCSSW
eukprot:385333_1